MMLADHEIQQLIQQTQKPSDTNLATQLITFIDLTSLNETDTPTDIKKLCAKVITTNGNVAGICVYPQFIATCQKNLANTPVKIVSVANFPHGSDNLDQTLRTMETLIAQHVDEIDVVMPYHKFLQGDKDFVLHFLKTCKEMCPQNILLKVILETGALENSQNIYAASCLAIEAGADFIKTSTGKTSVSATLEAAAQMLQAIKDSSCAVGFKASGGIRSLEQAAAYYYLAENILGKNYLTPDYFRIGASSLLDNLLKKCSLDVAKRNPGY